MKNNRSPFHSHSLLGYGMLNACSNIFAFSTTRHGGVSQGNYASFNCTPYTGDDPRCVERNVQILCQQFPQPPQDLIIPYQTHGTRVVCIDKHFIQADAATRHDQLQQTDALITALPDICLCISTADCIPVLLYDSTHQAIAAIHAGWRGTVNGIVPHTLQTMQQSFGTKGSDLQAAIGPGISLAAFEIGEEVYEAFRQAGFPMGLISEWKPESHKHHIDLWAAVRLQLQAFGIPAPQVESAGICTYSQPQDFFSARRLGIHSGRILTGIIRYRS